MGRFVREKGYHSLIEAFSALPGSLKNRSQLLLLGTGPLERELKSLTRKLKLSSRVLLPGFRSDVRKILEISDLVVFTSLWEGLSIALLEAMAASKAIVATDIAAFKDALEAGTEAILVPPTDSQALSTALQRLLEDESAREELGERAWLRFSNDFTAAKMIESYEKIYKQVLSRGKGSD